MKLLSTTALLFSLALGGHGYAQTTQTACKFNSGSSLAEIDIQRVSMTAPDVPITFEPGFSDADLSFAWGEVIASNPRFKFEDIDDTSNGLVFIKSGPALGATNATVDGKPAPVWRLAPLGSDCSQELVPRDVLSSGPSGYDFGGVAEQGGVHYSLWRKKLAARYETVLLAMTLKSSGRPAVTKIATLAIDAKGLTAKPNTQNGTVDFVMVGAKPRDRSAYLFALTYKPKPAQ